MLKESPSQFKNDQLTVTITHQPHCKATLDVTIVPAAIKAAYLKAVKAISKEVSIPGFRKGKAPDKMVIEHYGNYVDREWREVVMDTALREAIALTSLRPLNNDSVRVQINSLSKEEDSKLTATFEYHPILPQINARDLSLQKPVTEAVTQERVEGKIRELREHHATWQQIDPRPIREGDFVHLDIDILGNDGTTSPYCQDERFQVQEGVMGPWLRQALLGHSPGEVVEATSEPLSQDDKDFVSTRCRITIKSLQEPILPPVDEELAKKAGCQTVEQLHTNIRKHLEIMAEEGAKQALVKQLEEALLTTYPFEVPTSLIDERYQNRLKIHQEYIAETAKLPIAEAVKLIEPQVRQEIRNSAERHVKLLYLFDQAFQGADMEITKDDLIREFSKQRYLAPIEERVLHHEMKPEEIRQALINLICERRIKEKLLEQVQINDNT